jgi:CRP-like cAMP-binding protein
MDEGNALNFDQLKRYSLFGGITDAAFARIRPLVHLEHYDEGDNVVSEGSINDRVFFICSGSVDVLKHLEGQGTESCRRITVMKTGDTFGEMELIDVQPCAATVRARESTVTLTLSSHDLYKVSKMDLKTYTLLILNLARELSRRLRTMDDLMGRERPNVQVKNGD